MKIWNSFYGFLDQYTDATQLLVALLLYLLTVGITLAIKNVVITIVGVVVSSGFFYSMIMAFDGASVAAGSVMAFVAMLALVVSQLFRYMGDKGWLRLIIMGAFFAIVLTGFITYLGTLGVAAPDQLSQVGSDSNSWIQRFLGSL